MMTAGSLNPWVAAINNFGDSARNMQDILTKAEDLKLKKSIRELTESGGADISTGMRGGGSGGVESRPGKTFDIPDSGGGGDGGGGQGGGEFGQYAAPIIKFFRDKGYHDSAIMGIMANGLAEGGFAQPWKQSGARNPDGSQEQSWGHWQFNARGELPGYQRWARENGVTDLKDSINQARYIDYWINVNMPNFKGERDASRATDMFLHGFERPRTRYNGMREPALQRVQNFMRDPQYTRNPAAQTVEEQPSGGMALPPAGISGPPPATASPVPRTRPGGKTIPRAAMASAAGGPSGLRPPTTQVALARPGPFDSLAGPQPPSLYDRPQAPPPPSVLQQLAMNQALPGVSPYADEETV